jgi:ATP-dependent protease ClpP protease subunit
MAKVLKIQGEINPEMLENIAQQIEDQQIAEGDSVDVLFDSIGGAVDVAFAIAHAIEEMQELGVNVRAVAEGKVYSSAVVPFLAVDNRVALKGSSFMVHKATFENLDSVDKDQLRQLQNELEEYTDTLYDFYDDRGVTCNVRTYLKEGDGITIDKPQDMIDAGFISKVVNEGARIYNRLMRGIDRIFPVAPSFSYVKNIHQISDKIMTKAEARKLFADEFRAAMPAFAKSVAAEVKNSMTPEPEEEPMNEATAMSPEELAKLDGVMFKSAAEVDGSDEVKYLAHPTRAVEKDHFVVPIAEDGSVVKLAEGDHKVTVDGNEYMIHSTGDEWYIHSAGPANADDPEADPATEPAEGVPENVDDPEAEPAEEPEVDDKAKNIKPTNKKPLPKVTNSRVPAPKNGIAKAVYEAFAAYGPGCVGA